MSLKPALDMLKESFKEWKEDDALQLGAAPPERGCGAGA